MARAKRTARADARRRYRAEQALTDTAAEIEPDDEAPARQSTDTTRAPAPSIRRGFAAAFRESFRPLDVRGDLRALPGIALHTRALWLPILLTLASTVIFAAVQPVSPVTLFLFQYFVVTPAIGSVFLAGFMAPRASWLLGVIVGLVSAGVTAYLQIAGYVPASTPTARPSAQDVLLAAFSISPVLGALFASLAAWYRRFLTMTNPNRGLARSSSNAGRRPDGRTRASANRTTARR